MRILILLILLSFSGCNYQTMTTEEQIQFHRNYDGANGKFIPLQSYRRMYEKRND